VTGAAQPDPQLQARARAALRLIAAEHADPALMLSFVVWPSEVMLEAQCAPVARQSLPDSGVFERLPAGYQGGV
jgi:hypothetical protein